MRHPTLRLADLMEWIVASAAGMAILRTALNRSITPALLWESPGRIEWLLFGASQILAGVAVVEGVVLAGETIRRRGPAIWGPGRWAWSVAGLYLLSSVAIRLVFFSVRSFMLLRRLPTHAEFPYHVRQFTSDLLSFTNHTFSAGFAWTLVAGWVSARLAGWTGRAVPGPDLREWSGRAFAGLVVGSNLAHLALRMIRFDR